jgi:putative peptidoglycan lipid II flippase
MLIPASAVSAVLAVPITRLLYERGAFTADQTDVVAACLAAFTLGLTFNGAMLMLNRAFFSLQRPWIPTWVAVANLVLNAGLDAALYRVGVWGIPLATSIVNVAGTIGLVIVLRRRLGSLDGRAVARSWLLVAAASAAAAGVAFAVRLGLDAAAGRSLGGQLVSVGLGIVAGTATYLVSARLLGIRELGALLSLVGRSGRRSDGPP